jgi:hypothetical protein
MPMTRAEIAWDYAKGDCGRLNEGRSLRVAE